MRKIIKDLESGKEYIEDSGKIYFKTLNGYIVFLSKNYYFQRLHKLQDYFSDREPNEARRLVLENLSIGANPFEEDLSKIKVTCVYQSVFATCFKIEGYPESWSDKDIMFKNSLTEFTLFSYCRHRLTSPFQSPLVQVPFPLPFLRISSYSFSSLSR